MWDTAYTEVPIHLSLPWLPPFYCHDNNSAVLWLSHHMSHTIITIYTGEGISPHSLIPYHHGYYLWPRLLLLDYVPPGTLHDSAWPKRTSRGGDEEELPLPQLACRCNQGMCWHWGGHGVREGSSPNHPQECLQPSHTPSYHRNRSLLSLAPPLHTWGIKGPRDAPVVRHAFIIHTGTNRM